MRTRLTEFFIRDAQPRTKKYKLTDGNGLMLLVMPTGAKYWRFRYIYGPKRLELTVGRPYPETSLKQARVEADKLRILLAQGINPSEQRLQERIARHEHMANTFGDAANAWFEFRRKAWAARTASQVREYLDKDLLPALKHRPLGSITTRELSSLVGVSSAT